MQSTESSSMQLRVPVRVVGAEVEEYAELSSWIAVSNEEGTEWLGKGSVLKHILKEGSASSSAMPKEGYQVILQYTGIVDDLIFDDIYAEHGLSLLLGKNQYKDIIPRGLELALLTMKPAEEAIIIVPPHYAYGKDGLRDVPTNATLIYQVKLCEMHDVEDLSDNQDGAMFKRVLQKGTGFDSPAVDIKAVVNISATISSTMEVFAEQKNFEFIMDDRLEGDLLFPSMVRAVQSMKKGERSIFTVTPQYGYGAQGNAKFYILPNETLMYEIELLEFEVEEEFWKLDITKKLDVAERKKNEGNELFNSESFMRAIKKYQLVVSLFTYETELTPLVQEKVRQYKMSCHLNSAACYLKLENYEKVKEECNAVLALDSTNVKALYRRGRAASALNQLEEALADLEKSRELDATNFEVLQEIRVVRKRMADKKDKPKVAVQSEAKKENKGFMERFIESIFKPGVTKEHFSFLNFVFACLFILILTVLFVYGRNKYLYILLLLSVLLFVSLQWFVPKVLSADKDKLE